MQSPPIRIAILDSGIRPTHQAVKDSILFFEDENGEINEGSPYGYNATGHHTGYPEDTDGHGTHVAGIITASPSLNKIIEVEIKQPKLHENDPSVIMSSALEEGEQGIIRGIASIPGLVELIICKNIEPGITTDFVKHTIQCIRFARQHKARVINCSWGGALDDTGEFSAKGLDDLAWELSNPYKNENGEINFDIPDIVVVAAAGNLRSGQDPERRNKDIYPSYPAGLPLPNAIAVAASRKIDGQLAEFSYYGTKSVHLAAPGTGIISISCSGDNVYRKLSGTSMAAPHVTASIPWMMMKFANLNLCCQKLVEHICDKANKENPAILVQSGRLDLARALEAPTSLTTEEEQNAKKLEADRNLSLEKKKKK